MWQAVEHLASVPDYLLIDGMGLAHATIPCLKIIKGDQLSLSIAAASIIAKKRPAINSCEAITTNGPLMVLTSIRDMGPDSISKPLSGMVHAHSPVYF